MSKSYDPAKAHEAYLRRKAAGLIKKPDPKKQAEASKRYYEKKKAALKAQGLSTYYMNGGKPKKPSRTKEEAREYYLQRKEQGLPQKYYQDKMSEDPLFNRKAHIKRKRADSEWLTKRGDRGNVLEWAKMITRIRESNLPTNELAEEIASEKRLYICNNNHTHKETEKTVYRPRIRNTVLTDKQIEELKDFTLAQGLTSDMELIQTTVEYDGEMKGIDDRREEKKVDIYTAQSKYLDKGDERKIYIIKDKRERERERIAAMMMLLEKSYD